MSDDPCDVFRTRWDLGKSFPVPMDRVVAALAVVEEELGPAWVRHERTSSLGKSLVLLRQVRIGEAIAAARRAKADGLVRKLRRKLKATQPLPAAEIAEAEVIARLLPLSRRIEYEPPRPHGKRRPDIVQHRAEPPRLVEYEVTCVSQSARDAEETKALRELANALYGQLPACSVDVYLKVPIIDRIGTQVLASHLSALSAQADYREVDIEDVALVVFDPTGSVQLPGHRPETKAWIRRDGRCSGVVPFGPADRSTTYRRKTGLKYRSPGLAIVSQAVKSNEHTNIKLLRVFRPADDARAFQKVLAKAAQLSPRKPSCVVIDMGGSTALLEDWVELIEETFRTGRFDHPSMVWIREILHGTSVYRVRESVVTNDSATHAFPRAVIDELASTS